MVYATQSDLEKLLPVRDLVGLTDDDDTGAVNTATVDTALETASITIDGYLSDRYELPFSTPPAILTNLCVDIAGHLLHIRRQQGSEEWEKRHDNAIAFLEKVNSGKLKLGVGDPRGTGSSDTMEVDAADRIFTRDELDLY